MKKIHKYYIGKPEFSFSIFYHEHGIKSRKMLWKSKEKYQKMHHKNYGTFFDEYFIGLFSMYSHISL